MGYAQSELKFGATMVTPQFLNVSGENGLPLQSIRPTGDDVSDNVVIQLLDASGYTIDGASYMWINWAGDSYDQEAWVDDSDYTIKEGVTFAPGQGLWVYGSKAGQGLQTAGKVSGEDVSVQLKFGATATGNPFPVSVALQDIVPTGVDVSDNVVIQLLDASGYTVDGASYMWINWAGDSYDQEAWVDDSDYTIKEGVTSAPGQGLWVYGSSDSQYIRFPAPEL